MVPLLDMYGSFLCGLGAIKIGYIKMSHVKTIVDFYNMGLFYVEQGPCQLKMVHIKMSHTKTITDPMIWVFLMWSGWSSKGEALPFRRHT